MSLLPVISGVAYLWNRMSGGGGGAGGARPRRVCRLTPEERLRSRRRNDIAALVVGTCAAVSGLAIAAFSEPKETAPRILDRYVAATGGAAWEKVNSFVASGEIALKGQGARGTFTMTAKAPNRFRMTQNIAGMGETATAFDGKIAWSRDPFSGQRTLSGAEFAQIADQAALALRPGTWKRLYARVDLLGKTSVDGTPAYRIRLTPKKGLPEEQYYDVKTGLQIRSDQTVESPMGKVPIQNRFSDYRTVGGVKVPFLIRQTAGPTEVTMKVVKMQFNVPVADTLFAPPSAEKK